MLLFKYNVFKDLIHFGINMAKEARVDIEPIILMASFPPSLENDDEICPVLDLQGQWQSNRILSIQFSIDYGFTNYQNFDFVSCYFELENTEIQLIRYKKKIHQDEPFDRIKHCPEIMCFPTRQRSILGFELDISDNTNIFDKYILKRGCQLISCNYNVYGQTKFTTSMVKNSIFCLKSLFKTSTDSEAEMYSFQFLIETKFRHPFNDSNTTKTIHTSTFKLEFSPNKCAARFTLVNQNDYHMFMQ